MIPLSDEPIYPGLTDPRLKEIFAERELQIMESALEVFAEKGYASSSTKEIAEKAGIAEGTIFRYFKTKKDLLIRLGSALFEKLIIPFVVHSIEEILTVHRDEPLEVVLPLIIKDRLALFKANRRYIQLFLYEIQYHEEFRQAFLNEIIWKASGLVTTFLEEKQQKGEIRPDLNCRMTVFSAVGMTAAFLFWRGFFNGDEKMAISDDEIAEHITKILIDGIKLR